MKKNRTLSRVVMGASVTAMTVGLAMSFSLEAEASGGGGGTEKEWTFVPTKCVDEAGNFVRYSNNCDLGGTSSCNDNICD